MHLPMDQLPAFLRNTCIAGKQQVRSTDMKPRDIASIERVCNSIRSAHKAFPDMRVGQLIVNATWDNDRGQLFYLENDDLVEQIKDFVKEKQEPRTAG